MLEDCRRFGDDTIDAWTQKPALYVDSQDSNVKHGWTPTDRFFGTAKGISELLAAAWLRTTQINVSIQMTREWAMAVEAGKSLFLSLVNAGLVQKTGRFFTDSYQSEVLNPISGTTVTGLQGIVPRRRLSALSFDNLVYIP